MTFVRTAWRPHGAVAATQDTSGNAQAPRSEHGGVHDEWSRVLALLTGGALHPRRAARPAGRIRVLLAEALGLVLAGLRSALEAERDITVVGEARSGGDAVALATELRPDVVLMDLRLPGLDALAAARRLAANPELPQLHVVMFASDDREDDLVGALRSGINGFVFLEADPAEFLRAVRVVASGAAYLSPRAAQRLLEELAAIPGLRHQCPKQFDDLTARERELVLLVAQGLSNGEIAERLVISRATVKTHVSRAMCKLHVCDRAKLVALAYQTGFVTHHPRRHG